MKNLFTAVLVLTTLPFAAFAQANFQHLADQTLEVREDTLIILDDGLILLAQLTKNTAITDKELEGLFLVRLHELPLFSMIAFYASTPQSETVRRHNRTMANKILEELTQESKYTREKRLGKIFTDALTTPYKDYQ